MDGNEALITATKKCYKMLQKLLEEHHELGCCFKSVFCQIHSIKNQLPQGDGVRGDSRFFEALTGRV